MSSPTVFVTGAAGFIGSATLKAFRDAGARVRGVDLTASGPDVVAGNTLHPGGWAHALRGVDVVSPVYIDELVQGIHLAATRPEAAGQVFTMTAPRHVTTAEYFGRLAEAAGLPQPRRVPTPVGVALATAGDTVNGLRRRRTEANPISVRYLARSGSYSIDKARKLLGYAPVVDLDEGMRRTAEWLGSQTPVPHPPSAPAQRQSP